MDKTVKLGEAINIWIEHHGSFDWDGDVSDKLENITVNGMTLENWSKEWERLNDCKLTYKLCNDENQEESNIAHKK